MAVTKADLQAEIDRLRAENARLLGEKAPSITQDEALELGGVYNLNIGVAEVTGFYEEAGFQKVRFILKPVDPADGFSVLEDRKEVLMSTPIDRFKQYQRQFHLDQQQREALENRRSRRFKIKKGRKV
jgi:hypothetical protein